MTFSLPQYQRHLTLAGYEMRDVPFIDRADLFSIKGGDRVIEHLLTFEHGNSEYALRPEFTASAARSYANANRQVVRWQFSGPVFEDRAGNGNSEFQRQSIGAELMGVSGPLADSEMIGLAASGLLLQGVTDFQVAIGHAGLTRKLIERYTTDPQLIQFLLNQRSVLSDPNRGRKAVEATLETFLNLRGSAMAMPRAQDNEGLSELLASVTLRTSTLGGRTRDDIARRLLRKQRRTEEVAQIIRAIETLETWISLKGPAAAVLPQIYQFAEDASAFAAVVADLRTTLDLLEGYGIEANSVILQPDLNRIWEYYSGVVFELQRPDGVSLGGGGRYDGLLRLLGNPEDVPAVGFQINADEVVRQQGVVPPLPETAVLVGSRSHALSLTQWALSLRAQGIACTIHETQLDSTLSVVTIDSEGAQYKGKRFVIADVTQLAALLQETPVQ